MTDIPTNGTIGYTGSIETYTVASTGTYDIIAYGAEAGSAEFASAGDGAEIGGDFDLTAGDVLEILVGGEGGGGTNGGGGGTFDYPRRPTAAGRARPPARSRSARRCTPRV